MHYIFCYLLGFPFLSLEHLQFQLITGPILFFGLAKKRWQTDKLYCNFWAEGWLVGIAIVLGCVGGLI
jgi:hypothetical protein